MNPATPAAAASSPRLAHRIFGGHSSRSPSTRIETAAPDVEVYRAVRERRDATVAGLSVARRVGKRAYHALRELELAAA
jgi:hypothetical protein